MKTFKERLAEIQSKTGSLVCVGLDPDPARLPDGLPGDTLPEKIITFNREIIEATRDVCCAYKPNLAFFESLRTEGWRIFEETIHAIGSDHIIIADAKRGDIGNTGRLYAQTYLQHLPCDAVTVSPYMGADSVIPFLQYPGKAAFVLCLTSNPGSADFQEREMDRQPMYERVARMARNWHHNEIGTTGLVVGATKPEKLARVRSLAPELPFLIPGVGAQGGDARIVVENGLSNEGQILVNSSRSILYASTGSDFAEAAYLAAKDLRDLLNKVRN